MASQNTATANAATGDLQPRAPQAPTLPWWRRVQVEIGGRWQLFPDKNTTWRQWVISPGARLVWPGKEINPRTDWPEGAVRSEHMDMVTEDQRDPVTNLRRSRFFARYFWATCYLRVLGLDLGAAVLCLSPRGQGPATGAAAQRGRRDGYAPEHDPMNTRQTLTAFTVCLMVFGGSAYLMMWIG